MRRRDGALVPLESAICVAASHLATRGIKEFHGYELAKHLADAADRRRLTAYGTLYRALARLEALGLLRSRREDPAIVAHESRPGSRLYTLTAAGASAASDARKAAGGRVLKRRVVPA